MADLSVNAPFDFDTDETMVGGSLALTAETATLSKGNAVETFLGSFGEGGSGAGDYVSSIDFTSGGQLLWLLSATFSTFSASTALNLAPQAHGARAYYGYLLAGDDTIYSVGAGAVLDGYGGSNTLSYDTAASAVSANLANGTATTANGTDKFFHFTNLTGSRYADTLKGDAQNNVIDGAAGADVMSGGLGDDTYVIDSGLDKTIETPAGGVDTVRSLVSTTLQSNIENLELAGSGALEGIGNAANNRLIGNGGDNRIDGGRGADYMDGGDGNDLYIVDNVRDIVQDTGSFDDTHDTVETSVSVNGLYGVERIVLTGAADLSIVLNEFADHTTLVGNGGSNEFTVLFDSRNTLIGGKGDDVYWLDLSPGSQSISDRVIEHSKEGYDTVHVGGGSYVLPANVEALVSAGYEAYGNSLDNTISGADFIDGRGGDDTMSGAQTYVVDSRGDKVIETADGGDDTVKASISYTLGRFVENLQLLGRAPLSGTGNSQANYLIGNAGDNILDGGKGADTFDGGAGHDTYIIDNVNDRISSPSAGDDVAISSVSFELSNIDNLKLTGTADLRAVGNSDRNVIQGNSGANLIDGGGAGDDLLVGGDGDDVYVVTHGAKIVEHAGGGTDSVRSSEDYTLSANVENLSLTHSFASLLHGTGNSLDNTIIGGDEDDVLNGGGGADTLIGGGGNNTYVIDSVGDRIIDHTRHAVVEASCDFSLSAGLHQVRLLGSADLSATGTNTGDSLYGNAGDNFLDGGGGSDLLSGGAGNDTYVVDSTRDSVIENAGGGIDTIVSSVSFSLASLAVERLTLVGNDDIDAIGNTADNVLIGNDGSNELLGGTGIDQLIGRSGDDHYFVDQSTDVIVEHLDGGVDSVVSTAGSYRLSAHVENLTLDDSIPRVKVQKGYGNASDNPESVTSPRQACTLRVTPNSEEGPWFGEFGHAPNPSQASRLRPYPDGRPDAGRAYAEDALARAGRGRWGAARA